MLPCTQQQQQEHKKEGKSMGYFKLPRGRPPIAKVIYHSPPTPKEKVTSSLIVQSEISSLMEGTAVAVKGNKEVSKPAIKKNGKYTK